MNYQEYKDQIYNDTIDYIKDAEYLTNFADSDSNPDYQWGGQEFWEMMDEICMVVTGNDNGSYYCNRYRAKEALRDAVFDEDILSLLSAHCMIESFWRYLQEGDPESADVTVRCAMFYEIYDDVQAWVEGQIGRELD